MHANPDGHELVANWYMREQDPRAATLDGVPRAVPEVRRPRQQPRLLHVVAGRDDQHEPRALSRVVPADRLDHHQTAPAGTVMFAPPFRDPFNYVFDPLIPVGIDLVGAAMHARFAAEGKPGVTMRSGSSYSTWWNGGLADDGVLPQPDWPADRDDGRSDADRDSVRARPSAAERRPAVSRSRRRRGASASRSSTR